MSEFTGFKDLLIEDYCIKDVKLKVYIVYFSAEQNLTFYRLIQFSQCDLSFSKSIKNPKNDTFILAITFLKKSLEKTRDFSTLEQLLKTEDLSENPELNLPLEKGNLLFKEKFYPSSKLCVFLCPTHLNSPISINPLYVNRGGYFAFHYQIENSTISTLYIQSYQQKFLSLPSSKKESVSRLFKLISKSLKNDSLKRSQTLDGFQFFDKIKKTKAKRFFNLIAKVGGFTLGLLAARAALPTSMISPTNTSYIARAGPVHSCFGKPQLTEETIAARAANQKKVQAQVDDAILAISREPQGWVAVDEPNFQSEPLLVPSQSNFQPDEPRLESQPFMGPLGMRLEWLRCADFVHVVAPKAGDNIFVKFYNDNKQTISNHFPGGTSLTLIEDLNPYSWAPPFPDIPLGSGIPLGEGASTSTNSVHYPSKSTQNHVVSAKYSNWRCLNKAAKLFKYTGVNRQTLCVEARSSESYTATKNIVVEIIEVYKSSSELYKAITSIPTFEPDNPEGVINLKNCHFVITQPAYVNANRVRSFYMGDDATGIYSTIDTKECYQVKYFFTSGSFDGLKHHCNKTYKVGPNAEIELFGFNSKHKIFENSRRAYDQETLKITCNEEGEKNMVFTFDLCLEGRKALTEDRRLREHVVAPVQKQLANVKTAIANRLPVSATEEPSPAELFQNLWAIIENNPEIKESVDNCLHAQQTLTLTSNVNDLSSGIPKSLSAPDLSSASIPVTTNEIPKGSVDSSIPNLDRDKGLTLDSELKVAELGVEKKRRPSTPVTPSDFNDLDLPVFDLEQYIQQVRAEKLEASRISRNPQGLCDVYPFSREPGESSQS